jgi:hypothetical protein
MRKARARWLTLLEPALSEHPYIRVVYRTKESSGTYAMDILYEYVEIVRRRGPSLKYSSGNYQADISLARIDGRILKKLQEHHSVADYEKLAAAKPEKRYKLMISGEVTPS